MSSNVFRFPSSPDAVEPIGIREGVHRDLVDHDGRLYRLDELLAQLPPARAADLDAAAPRTGQETWDTICRRWPVLAASIVAGTRPVSSSGEGAARSPPSS